jgi:hypothetical protein
MCLLLGLGVGRREKGVGRRDYGEKELTHFTSERIIGISLECDGKRAWHHMRSLWFEGG